jgi:hypothetical protein
LSFFSHPRLWRIVPWLGLALVLIRPFDLLLRQRADVSGDGNSQKAVSPEDITGGDEESFIFPTNDNARNQHDTTSAPPVIVSDEDSSDTAITVH